MSNFCSCEPEDLDPPAFWTPVTASDLVFFRTRSCRRRFDVSLVYSVAKRCSAGYPQVVVCLPVTSKGIPFPTMFWLTCPYLERRCGELESQQKIYELEEIFKTRLQKVISWHKEYSLLRASLLKKAPMQKEAGAIWKGLSSYGVGGINWEEVPYAVKCLHLQTATWLGLNTHPVSDWLLNQFEVTECVDKNCSNISK